MKVINLISGPRNISTALMYSFASRPDFRVQDEPFYGYYLDKATLSISHPLHQEIIDAMQVDQDQIVAQIQREMVEVKEQFAGCEWFSLYEASVGDRDFLLYEEWESKEAFYAYRNSDYFAENGKSLFAMLDGPPSSAYFAAEKEG